MSKIYPGRPMAGRQGSNVIFFSSNLQRSPWRKKKRGPVAPPNGRQGPYFNHWPPFAAIPFVI